MEARPGGRLECRLTVLAVFALSGAKARRESVARPRTRCRPRPRLRVRRKF
jgi:hypothetical protein